MKYVLSAALLALGSGAFAAPRVRLAPARARAPVLITPTPSRLHGSASLPLKLAAPAVSLRLPAPAIQPVETSLPQPEQKRRVSALDSLLTHGPEAAALTSLKEQDMPGGAWSNFLKVTGLFSGGKKQAETAAPRPDETAEAHAATQRLLEHVDIDDSHPGGRQVFQNVIHNMMKSPTARRLAGELGQTGERIKLAFEDKPNTQLVTVNGIKQPSGGLAHYMDDPEKGPMVVLNKLFLSSDPSFIMRDGATSLAHELLGHGLGTAKAKQSGVQEAYNWWRDNETNAGLTEWVVGLELGLPRTNSFMWLYAQEPESYHEQLHTVYPYYSTTFSRAESADPLAALMRRRTRVGPAIAAAERTKTLAREWLSYTDHLVSEHGYGDEALVQVREELHNHRILSEQRKENLLDIEHHLNGAIEQLERPEFKEWTEALAHDFGLEFFDRAEAEVNALAARLQELLDTPEPALTGELAAAPAPAYKVKQVTLDDLVRLQAGDSHIGKDGKGRR